MSASKFMVTLSSVKYYIKKMLHMRVPFASFSEVCSLSEKYNLPYQLDALYQFGLFTDYHRKSVLEIGGCQYPEALIFDCMKSARWVSVDYLDFWWPDERIKWITSRLVFECPVVPIAEVNPQNTSARHIIISGSINDLPEIFNEQFDLAVSVATLEHISDLPVALKHIYDSLRPGGLFCASFGPIWSGPNGHHLGIGNIINFKVSEQYGISPHEHLLCTAEEFREKFKARFDTKTLDLIVHNIYFDKTTNRLFYEDYLKIFDASAFRSYKIMPSRKFVPDETQKCLRERYPEYEDFSTLFACVYLQK